ncbi:PadR family transcriptional regulator [Ornithinibacillus halophilus]|nr:PadR family transcriptional regulator [Ornithinibacillus halophilus]
MTEAMYYVLLALINPLHGYAVMDEVHKVSNKRVTMGPGTLYGILKRLQKMNYIRMTKSDGRRKVYHITSYGEKALEQEYQRLASLVQDGKHYWKGADNDE